MSIVKKTFCIPDMHCSACVMKLEGLEDELPGVLLVEGSYHKRTLVVEYDDNMVEEVAIRSTIQGFGYTVDNC
jgi:copper chaperone CopZ